MGDKELQTLEYMLTLTKRRPNDQAGAAADRTRIF